jgi:dihydroorotate dehydrogenase (fumarate)
MERVTVGKHTLHGPIYNAAGVHCVNTLQLDELHSTEHAGAVLTKSSTLQPRLGNPSPRYFFSDEIRSSVNSSGLPNIGMEGYIRWIESKPQGKPCILSIAPLSREELVAQMGVVADRSSVVDPEINLSCPNIAGKPQVAYDLSTFEEYNRAIAEILGEKGYGLKLPPYFDDALVADVVDVVNSIPTNSYLTCVNSIPNALVLDDLGRPVLAANEGFGGLGGEAILPIALASVKKFSAATNNDIVGCGGITRGRHGRMHMACGAKAVQIGTTLRENGPGEFGRIHEAFEASH